MATSISLDWQSDDAPLQVVRTLRQAGHEAWLAGGCVRDLLLGRAPKDHDVATSATPEQVKAAFRRTVPVQPELGVTMVLWNDARLEVTTFRTEGPYLDGRRPTHVAPTDARGDVQRRDFTINGLLLDPESGEVVDHVGGIADLRAGLLRCIGQPRDRFGEDHLRILRAVRFAVRFDLRIDPGTWEAMCDLASHLPRLSGERLRDELDRMFAQAPFARCLDLLVDSGALAALLPELDQALARPEARQRLHAVCTHVPANTPGLWIGLLGAPLSPWWDTPWTPGERASVHPGQERLLGLLKASRAEMEGARFLWRSWPEAWIPRPRLPSRMAPLVRDRSYPCLQGALEQLETTLDAPWSAATALRDEASRIPSAPPALGEAFQELGVPRGPRLGEAIRLLDRRMLDESRPADESLLREVALTILGPS
jgi:hypothetical protein